MDDFLSSLVNQTKSLFQDGILSSKEDTPRFCSAGKPTIEKLSESVESFGNVILEMPTTVTSYFDEFLVGIGQRLENTSKARRKRARDYYQRKYLLTSSCVSNPNSPVDETKSLSNSLNKLSRSSEINSKLVGEDIVTLTDIATNIKTGIPKSASETLHLNFTSDIDERNYIKSTRKRHSNIESKSVVDRLTPVQENDSRMEEVSKDMYSDDAFNEVIAELENLRSIGIDPTTLVQSLEHEKRYRNHVKQWLTRTNSPKTGNSTRISDNEQYLSDGTMVSVGTDFAPDKYTPLKSAALNVKIQFLFVSEALKVSVYNLQDICDDLKLNKETMFEVAVIPEHGRKKKTMISSKKAENVQFNQDIHFKNIKLENVSELCLRFRWYQNEKRWERKRCLGETFVYMKDLDILGNNTMLLDLYPKPKRR
ncbi:hypothetical protein ACF0H5_022543 [Mactra antiquata]